MEIWKLENKASSQVDGVTFTYYVSTHFGCSSDVDWKNRPKRGLKNRNPKSIFIETATQWRPCCQKERLIPAQQEEGNSSFSRSLLELSLFVSQQCTYRSTWLGKVGTPGYEYSSLLWPSPRITYNVQLPSSTPALADICCPLIVTGIPWICPSAGCELRVDSPLVVRDV